ncbi:uncharacterized protein KY384_008641 [Bacidia gigantensis]|uniref:uncharacterized protein n=1 Tax=Bacidia gigantensis TaxID=2732470 RepID=UPI001D050272|nr:uncharacterized protein KY384_008641 [Bacidia gigantensis]KAG8527211.1 hypothetical protein KY384_008641 [Bacidia gigantensis]
MSVALQDPISTDDSSSDNAEPKPRAPVMLPEHVAHAKDLPYAEREELHENEVYEQLGFCFPTWKKWSILTVIFLVQTSMNFNTSLYSNAVNGISYDFGVSKQAARLGAALFLITYAFGCELWAPWSEEFGRKPVLQASLFLVNLWQIPVALAPNFGTILVCRSLGGLSTAGGSVTLGMVADLWEAEDQQYAVAFVVFSSVGGSILGPVVGGFTEQFLDWKWSIWIQLIFGGAIQLVHLLVVPETRTAIMVDRIAKKKRKENPRLNIYGPSETQPFKERFSAKEIVSTWLRPFQMFLTEPIVLTLSLLSGFSDALIFMFIQSFALVYELWNFKPFAIGLAFLPILIGYFIAWAAFIPAFKRNKHDRLAHPGDEKAQYESRLYFLLWLAPCLPIGLLGYGYTCTGPPLHWIGSMVFAAVIGIANYAIYMATIDYMICAYGPYSASATGGNGWSRDILAGILTLPATPFFQNIGPKEKTTAPNHLSDAFMILFCISIVLVAAVYVIYWYGPVLRKRSPFAQQLAKASQENNGRSMSVKPTNYGSTSASRSASVARARSSIAGGRGNLTAAHQERLDKIAEANGIEGAGEKA